MVKAYTNSFSYQAFMRRAFRSRNEGPNDFTHNTVYLLLHHLQGGYRLAGVSYEKHFAKVKNLLLKGTDKVLKWKLTANERSEVMRNAMLIERAYCGDDLLFAINGLLDATQRFRNY